MAQEGKPDKRFRLILSVAGAPSVAGEACRSARQQNSYLRPVISSSRRVASPQQAGNF